MKKLVGAKSKLGKKIRIARKDSGLSQKQLGLQLRVSDKAVSSYEIGRTAPSFEVLKKISRVVHKPLSYFDETAPEEESDLAAKVARIEQELSEVKKLLKKQR